MDKFKLKLLKTIIKTDDLETELIGLKGEIDDVVLDFKVQKCRDSCTQLRKRFERFFCDDLNYTIGEYLDGAKEASDAAIDKFIKEN